MYEDDDELISLLRKALEDNDVESAEGLVDDNEEDYDGDLTEIAFRIAVQVGCYDYVSEHYEDVELNDEGFGESSSYLHETDDESIIDLLTSVGAYRSWDEYSDYKFAVETVNGSVLSFDSDFQKEVFEKLLKELGLSEKKVVEMLDNGNAEEYELPEKISCMDIDNLQEACDILLASSDGEHITFGEFDYMDDSIPGSTLRELVENLGWDCSFEGESWKFETNGVYFIQ